MSTAAILRESHELLDRLDPRLLSGVHALLRSYESRTTAAGQSSNGDEDAPVPMSVDEIKARALESHADYLAGDIYTIDEVAQELNL